MFAIGKTAENLKIEKLTLFSILPQYRVGNRWVTNFQGCNATYLITFVNVDKGVTKFRLFAGFCMLKLSSIITLSS